MIGKTLGHYQITSQLGKGGMGEVFQAKDQKLGRNVAIKVLPEEFARDGDRVARFQREAKLLASLNHPNIAAIHGLEGANGTHVLLPKLFEGDTLADRIKSGQVPVEEAQSIYNRSSDSAEDPLKKAAIFQKGPSFHPPIRSFDCRAFHHRTNKKGGTTMEELIKALGPAFAAGFAIQRLMEILDPIIDKKKFFQDYKKAILGVVSLIVGLILAFGIGLRVLQPLGVENARFLDAIVTAFVISAGTEGFNSIMKFLGYAKEDKKVEASEKKAKANLGALKELTKAV